MTYENDGDTQACDTHGDAEVSPDVPQVTDTRIGGANGIKPGRPKGAKNKSTLLKEALRGDFDDMLVKKAKQIFNVVADQALDGCRQSQKMILDRVVPTVHAESDKDKNPFSGGIVINIGSLEDQKSVTIDGDFEEAEYTD